MIYFVKLEYHGKSHKKRTLVKTQKQWLKKNKEIDQFLETNRKKIESEELLVFFLDECHLVWGDICGYVWGELT